MLEIIKRLVGAETAADMALLKGIAEHKSCPVEQLSIRLAVASEALLEKLSAWEDKGLVRVSQDKGSVHARIVAMTQKGREHLRATADTPAPQEADAGDVSLKMA
jgi:hypothetical protein